MAIEKNDEDQKVECNIVNFKDAYNNSIDNDDDDDDFKLKEDDFDSKVDSVIEIALETISSRFMGSGIYQFFSLILLSVTWTVAIGWHPFSTVFSAHTSEHECYIDKNLTNVLKVNGSCNILNITNNFTYECNKWVYNTSEMKSTIISEYDFVCSRNYYFETAYSLEQIGFMVGALIFSLTADRLGRKKVLIVAMFCFSILGIIQYWVKNFYIFMSIGFIINCFASGLDSVCVPLVLETYEIKKRTRYGMMIAYIWVLVFSGLSPLAYIIRTWRELRLAIFVTVLVISIISFFFICESLTWLISKFTFDQARHEIKKIAKINRIAKTAQFKENFNKINNYFNQLTNFKNKCEPDQKQGLIDENVLVAEKKKSDFFDAIKHKKFFLYLFIMSTTWSAAGLVYDGLTYLNSFIGYNIYINWLLMSTIELPGQLCCHFLISKFGRRIIGFFAFITTGIILLANIVNYMEQLEKYTFLKVITLVTAKLTVGIAFSVIMFQSTELFPTNIRSFCYGICLCSARLTGTIAPFISLYFVSLLILSSKVLPWLPTVIYGTLTMICGIMCLNLPETLNRPLPNSVHDVLKLTRSVPKLPETADPTILLKSDEKSVNKT